jgi:hypothetical protein
MKNKNIDKLYELIDRGESRVLYVYGPPGSGKTHLIHQIAERYASEHPSANVLYVKSRATIDRNRLKQADIIVLDEFDSRNTSIDEAKARLPYMEIYGLIGHKKILLVSGRSNPADESSFSEGARMLLEKATTFNVLELLPAQTGLSPELTIYVDPGSASAEAVGELLSELSHLYRMIGGSGITFTNLGVAYPEGVL